MRGSLMGTIAGLRGMTPNICARDKTSLCPGAKSTSSVFTGTAGTLMWRSGGGRDRFTSHNTHLKQLTVIKISWYRWTRRTTFTIHFGEMQNAQCNQSARVILTRSNHSGQVFILFKSRPLYHKTHVTFQSLVKNGRDRFKRAACAGL